MFQTPLLGKGHHWLGRREHREGKLTVPTQRTSYPGQFRASGVGAGYVVGIEEDRLVFSPLGF